MIKNILLQGYPILLRHRRNTLKIVNLIIKVKTKNIYDKHKYKNINIPKITKNKNKFTLNKVIIFVIIFLELLCNRSLRKQLHVKVLDTYTFPVHFLHNEF